MAIDLDTPISWQTVEDALYDWVHNVLGINVQWANQAEPQSEYPFVLLSIEGPTEIGTGDEKRISEKLDDVGAGLDLFEYEHRGQREITFEAQINVGPPQNQDPRCHGKALASKLLASLNLQEYWIPLDTAGLSVIAPLPITDASLTVADMFIDRRVFEVRFGLASSVTEDIEIIQKAEVTGTVSGTFDGNPLTVGPIDIDSTV